jgi:hypothetical protein
MHRDLGREAAFYPRFGITQAQFRNGAGPLKPVDVDTIDALNIAGSLGLRSGMAANASLPIGAELSGARRVATFHQSPIGRYRRWKRGRPEQASDRSTSPNRLAGEVKGPESIESNGQPRMSMSRW